MEIFGRVLPSYGVIGVSGGVLGLLLAMILARIHHQDKKYTDDLVYIYVFACIGAMIGAKLLYIFTVFPDFLQDLQYLFSDPSAFFRIYFSGGFVLYGGIIGAYFTAEHMAGTYGRRLQDFYPSLLPALALVCGIGRIGCFAAGCCYGIDAPPDCPIGVIFPAGGIAPAGVPLIPVQLIEAGVDFVLAGLMVVLTWHKRTRRCSLYVYAAVYALARFIIEFYRGDAVRGFWLGLSTSQWISIAVVLAVGICAVRRINISGFKSK